jgi:hypothetical protein
VAAAGFVAMLAVAAGCASIGASVVELKPDIAHVPALAEVPKDVGIRYPRAFRDHVYALSPPIGATQSFAVGAASVGMLDDVISKVFRRAVALQEGSETPAAGLDAVLVPEIRELSVQIAPPLAGRWWFLWGRLTYRFTVTSPSGAPITAWNVTGTAEQLGDAQTETLPPVMARLLTRCIQDAGIRFMRGFYDVPEAERWARNLNVDEVDSPRQAQVIDSPGDGAALTRSVIGLLPGVAKAEVRPRAETRLVLEIRVENQGAHPLLLSPAGMALVLPSSEPQRPVPVYAYAASQLQREATTSGRLPYIPPPAAVVQPSMFAAYHLIFALAALASMEVEKKTKAAFDAQLEKFRGNELREQRLSAGAATTGDVHFVVPERAVPAGQPQLVVPIVDLETATRYEMRLPLRLGDGVKP